MKKVGESGTINILHMINDKNINLLNQYSMEKLVAKIVIGYDIAYMYNNENRPGTCPICHNIIEQIPDPLYKVPKKKGDLFYTYDHFCIVSEKFKRFCDERAYPHLTFVALTKSVGYYFFVPQDIYKLDYIRPCSN